MRLDTPQEQAAPKRSGGGSRRAADVRLVKVASAPDLSRAVEVAFTEDHSKQFSNRHYTLPLSD